MKMTISFNRKSTNILAGSQTNNLSPTISLLQSRLLAARKRRVRIRVRGRKARIKMANNKVCRIKIND